MKEYKSIYGRIGSKEEHCMSIWEDKEESIVSEATARTLELILPE